MAKENLSKAIEIFKESGADGWVKILEEELAKARAQRSFRGHQVTNIGITVNS